MTAEPTNPTAQRTEALAWGIPVGMLGGLIGLGGGEFRIPILLRRFALDAKAVIAVNATISLFTLAASLAFRGGALSFSMLPPFALDIASLAAGGIIAAFFVSDFVKRIASHTLHTMIVFLLIGLGLLVIAEGLVPLGQLLSLPSEMVSRALIGVGIGLLIGAVATLLGVAGGELLIPTFIFIYGVDVKTAGTASLIVSLAVVTTSVGRFYMNRSAPSRALVTAVGLPMGVGSIIGAAIGAQLAWLADPSVLKVVLGCLLLAAAWISARR